MKDKDVATTEKNDKALREKSFSKDIASFLKAVGEVSLAQSGRLIFALDATNSRQPTWDRAMNIQSSMFDAVGKAGGLSVQLVYFRGFNECRASKWVINASALHNLMLGIQCQGGQTQIEKVLNHAYGETTKGETTKGETTIDKVSALVFIGDALEENIDLLCQKAGELSLKGVRCFFFQEGHDIAAENGFREMARLTGGAYFRLGPDSAKELAELLSAVAMYAKGGLKALSSSNKKQSRLLLQQMTK